jgi:hypothetical protein
LHGTPTTDSTNELLSIFGSGSSPSASCGPLSTSSAPASQADQPAEKQANDRGRDRIAFQTGWLNNHEIRIIRRRRRRRRRRSCDGRMYPQDTTKHIHTPQTQKNKNHTNKYTQKHAHAHKYAQTYQR